jgi:hypothetical protein
VELLSSGTRAARPFDCCSKRAWIRTWSSHTIGIGEGRDRREDGNRLVLPHVGRKKSCVCITKYLTRLLEILPLPFLIVAGRCAKKHYQEGRKHLVKKLNVKLKGNVSTTFEISFDKQSVQRITAFVDHPAATIFNPNSAAQYSLRLDAALNFVMWLLALPHNEMSFTETSAKFRKVGRAVLHLKKCMST